MSRIGRKPIPLPSGVKYKVEGNTVLVEGPKGKVSALIAEGITLKTTDGHLHLERSGDDKAAVHGLTRALVHNAVEGVTKGWTKELDIVGIGYRAELKGKGTVVFTLGFSHPIEYMGKVSSAFPLLMRYDDSMFSFPARTSYILQPAQ